MPSPNPQTFTVIEQRGIVTTLVKLNIRKQPATNGPVIAVMTPQKGIEFSALIPDGEMISNNSVWYRDTNGNYFWSGGVAVSAPVLPDSKSGKAKINFSGIDFSGIELPITQHQCSNCTNWLQLHFENQFSDSVKNTPFEKELLYAIACQETAIYWQKWINDHTPDEILARCVFDANGDVNGTRHVFPKNTTAFIERYGQQLANELIAEANATRAIRSWGPKQWVYAVYGIFQYDIQAIQTDEAFFTQKLWYHMPDCLDRVIKELNSKWAAHPNDLFATIKAYNGSGQRAENYAKNVSQFLNWIEEAS